MKKALVALASGAVLLLGALPALGQGGISASISGVGNGQVLQDSVTITGSASATSGVESITIAINNDPIKKQNWGGVQQNASTSAGWNTRGYNNGHYTLKVTAVSNGGSTDNATASVLVDNPPATPSGLYTSHSDGVVTVGWNANPESDVFAYRVNRNGNFLTETSGTTITDTPGVGDHTYSVTAVRRSPTEGNGKTGGSASTSINVPQPPPPSTGGDTGSGTGSGSGSGSGDPGSGSGSYGNTGSYGNPNAGGYGYNGGKGGKNNGYGYQGGKPGKNGGANGGVLGYGSYFSRNLAGIGLPSNITLPGNRLTGYNPAATAPVDDGTFEETLPFDLSQGEGGELLGEIGGTNVAARRTSFLIPPDGLRWIAAGLWFIVTAALLKFLEQIVAKREEEEAALALATAATTDGAPEDPSEETKAVTPKLKLVRRKEDAA